MTSERPVNVFVARDGNAFMRDIATWIAEASCQLGRRAKVIDNRLPTADGSINLVVAPHEFYVLRADSDFAVRAASRHSVPICTEQPGTPWFNLAVDFCSESPLVVDINAAGYDEFKRRGMAAARLRLGGVPSMRWTSEPRDRDVDVLFLGGNTARRAQILASIAPLLWNRRAEIRTFTFSRPLSGEEPGVVFGAEKYELLSRSKLLVNLHRSEESGGYFEWARMVETMANGCVVLTEPSVDHDPLVDGEHFVSSMSGGLGDTLIDLLQDHDRRAELASQAQHAVLDTFPLSASLGPLLDRVDAIQALPARTRHGRLSSRRTAKPIERGHAQPLHGEFRPHASRRKEVFDLLMAEMRLRRDIDATRCLVRHGIDGHTEVIDTPAWADARPEVSVVVTLFDYADLVAECIESVIATTGTAIEIVIVDDHSTDLGRAVIQGLLESHPSVPLRLVASDVNRGLPASRNLAFAHTRADKMMVMDADNAVYPTCLRRLADALDEDQGASFAYATLETFGDEQGLASAQGWFVPWLCDANYIDAQAMIRRSAFERHDGYRVDDAIHGWEDWALWLRFAVAGEYGVHVPQMLGRYRTQTSSMISITNLVADELRQGLVDRYPSLPWPERKVAPS